MADQNTSVERERIGTPIDEDITGLESREERDRVGSFADTDRAPSRPRVTASTASTPTAARDSRTREIRAEIEQTREDLSETVNAIQDRLQPSTLASNAVDSVKDAARERFHDIADTETVQYVRANPMPTAMIGIGLAGLAWLAFGRETHDTRSARLGRPARLARPGPATSPNAIASCRATGWITRCLHGREAPCERRAAISYSRRVRPRGGRRARCAGRGTRTPS